MRDDVHVEGCAPEKRNDVSIDLDHNDPGGADAETLGDEGDRERNEVVVAEQENASAVERARFVHREHAPDLRLDVAVHLIELDSCSGRTSRERRKPPCNGREGGGDDDLPLCARRAGCFGREVAAR